MCNIFMQDRKRVFFSIYACCCFLFHRLVLRMLFMCSQQTQRRTFRIHSPAVAINENHFSFEYNLISSCCALHLAVEWALVWNYYYAFLFFFLFSIRYRVMWCKLNGVMVWLHWIDLTSATHTHSNKHKYFAQCTKCISNYCYTFLFFCSVTVDIDFQATSRRLYVYCN